MAETTSWCNMISTLFYILAAVYFVQLYFFANIVPVGTEFASLVILGLLAILQQKVS
jgi:hypothetical protein